MFNSFLLTKKILDSIQAGDVRIYAKKMNIQGASCGDVIFINPYRPDPLTTLVHEMIHVIYPSLKEKEVEKMALLWGYKSTWNQKKALLQELVLI